jgi:hypothetical protein
LIRKTGLDSVEEKEFAEREREKELKGKIDNEKELG